jgi:hypothetical protein
MSTNQYVPILFYSERCPNSLEVIKTIQALNRASLFRFVSVDTTPRHLFPPELRGVPSLYVPDTKQMITGKSNIFAILSKPVQSRREVPTPRQAPTKPADPLFWSFNDSSNLSTNYSSFDGVTQTPDDQLRYSYLDGEIRTTGQDPGIGPTTESSFEGSKTGRNDDVMSRLEQLQSTRDTEYVHITRQ